MACNSRDRLSKYLFDRRIENKVIYSPLACDAKVYKETCKKAVPVARRLLNQSISIPLHEKMTIKQAEYVIKEIRQFYQ